MRYVIFCYQHLDVEAGDCNPEDALVGIGDNLDDAVAKADAEYKSRCEEEECEYIPLLFEEEENGNTWVACDDQYGRTWVLAPVPEVRQTDS